MTNFIFCVEYCNGDKIKFAAYSLKDFKSKRTKYAKKNDTSWLHAFYAHQADANGERLEDYKIVSNF